MPGVHDCHAVQILCDICKEVSARTESVVQVVKALNSEHIAQKAQLEELRRCFSLLVDRLGGRDATG